MHSGKLTIWMLYFFFLYVLNDDEMLTYTFYKSISTLIHPEITHNEFCVYRCVVFTVGDYDVSKICKGNAGTKREPTVTGAT